MLFSLLVLLVILCIVAWIISILPLPASPIPFRTIAYVVLALIAIYEVMKLTGVHL